MKKGQGSLEYLLILAAILAIAVVVVVVANSLLAAPQEQTQINEDKYGCSLQGIELVNYNSAFGSTGVPTVNPNVFSVKYNGNAANWAASGSNKIASCNVGIDGNNQNKPFVLELHQSGTTYTYALTAST